MSWLDYSLTVGALGMVFVLSALGVVVADRRGRYVGASIALLTVGVVILVSSVVMLSRQV